MVLTLNHSHTYSHGFDTSTIAYFNRYPNPYAKHVLSSDTLESYVDANGCLRTTRLVVKTGRLPSFIKPFLGERLNSWIIEKSIVDPKRNTMVAYSANIDHRKFIKVEEYLTYSAKQASTSVDSRVQFSSNFIGFKQRIEQWSHNRFLSNMKASREGLLYVMSQIKARQTS